MKKINNFDKLLVLCIIAVILLNPLTGQYVLLGINYVLDMLMVHGVTFISAPTAYIIGYFIYKARQSNKLNIPKRSK